MFAIFVIYFIDTRITEPLNIPPAPDENWSFGILADAEQLSILLSNGSKVIVYSIYAFLLIFCLAVAIRYSKQFKSFVNLDLNHEFYGYAFWFFLCMVFRNQTYRLALFIFLFAYLIIKSVDRNYLTMVYIAIFLNPIFFTHLPLTKYVLSLIHI